MKKFATLALLGHISAIHLNQKFIEDNDDSDYVVNKKGNLVEKGELAASEKAPIKGK